jgi:N6-L-threonylcarbamoyladenine synthase
MKVLGIESSCDETSASVVIDGKKVISLEISSSLKFHRKYGGVIPEIASRMQLETIKEVVSSALEKASITLKDIKLISVTNGPGLVGSLLVGISFAKALAYANNTPIVGVNHIKAHLYPAFFQNKKPRFPFIGLIISGGHTSLYLVKDFDNFQVLGSTRDDACGEAFDKAAKILNLGYPGGPKIESLATSGNTDKIKFSFQGLKNSLDFSFSGIKTALLYMCLKNKPNLKEKSDMCASFQKAVTKLLIEKSNMALDRFNAQSLVLGGGVSVNGYLRKSFQEAFKDRCFLPEKEFCMDNAAMIAGLGFQIYKSGKRNPADLRLN